MTTKKALSVGLIASLLVTFSFISCKKDSKSSGDSDIDAVENNALAESDYNDVTTMVDLAVTNGNSMTFRTEDQSSLLDASCVTVTLDTVSSPRTVTIDFGSANCLCLDGRNRRGKILASYTGKYKEAGTVINITFDNYFVNDNQVKGTKKVTNMGNNNAGHLVYKVEVTGQIIKSLNRGTISWTSTREREWLAGANTLNPLDDVYSITGTASGINANETAYTIAITQALVRKMNCRWFESGKVEVTPAGKQTRTLDYGATGCDANAKVTIAGITFDVVLP
jgi:hypothetical protein